MTRDEFTAQFSRLCEGHRFDPTAKQIEAFYELLQRWDGDDFRVAVTRLTAARGFPANVDLIAKEIERAGEERRRAAATLERMQAQKFIEERVALRSPISSDMEYQYVAARMTLLRAGLRGEGRATIQAHRLGLGALLADEQMWKWMEQEMMGACRFHLVDHRVLDCVRDEWAYWTQRDAGLNPVAALRELAGASLVPIDERLLLRTDAYGRVLADQVGALPFDKDGQEAIEGVKLEGGESALKKVEG